MSGHPHKQDIEQRLTYEENKRNILEALKEKPRNITELSSATGISRQTIYQHISNLKKENLVFQKGRRYFLADKGTSLLEKLKVLDMVFQLDMTQELSLPLDYSKNLYKLLKRGAQYRPTYFDKLFDMQVFGKIFPHEVYKEYGVKKVNKMRAQLAALLLCKAFKVSIFQQEGSTLELSEKDKGKILTNIWNSTVELFKKGTATKFAVVITFDMDSANSYLPEVKEQFYK